MMKYWLFGVLVLALVSAGRAGLDHVAHVVLIGRCGRKGDRLSAREILFQILDLFFFGKFADT